MRYSSWLRLVTQPSSVLYVIQGVRMTGDGWLDPHDIRWKAPAPPNRWPLTELVIGQVFGAAFVTSSVMAGEPIISKMLVFGVLTITIACVGALTRSVWRDIRGPK